MDFKNEEYDQLNQDIIKSIENMNREHHGFTAIGKILSGFDSSSHKSIDIDISIRNDLVNEKKVMNDIAEKKNWNQTTIKFSSNYKGSKNNIMYHGFINYGKNVKFPTMMQK